MSTYHIRPAIPANRIPHDFELDEGVPRDHLGRRFCAACGRPGRAGDRNHPPGALPTIERRYPPVPDEVAEVERRRFGGD